MVTVRRLLGALTKAHESSKVTVLVWREEEDRAPWTLPPGWRLLVPTTPQTCLEGGDTQQPHHEVKELTVRELSDLVDLNISRNSTSN